MAEYKADFIVVGSGLTGSSIARILHDAGRKVLVVERRSQPGGNVVDHLHESGVRVHTYGPHYFRTDSDLVWDFVRKYAEFYPYEAVLKTLVDGKLENWPVLGDYIKKNIGTDYSPAKISDPENFEEAALKLMPGKIYDSFIYGYTKKQWGVEPSELSPNLIKRFDVRWNNDPRLKISKYQGIPRKGYSRFIKSMLKNIPVLLNIDYLKNKNTLTAEEKIIFTGPIDEFFGFSQGKLTYRGQIRKHEYFHYLDDYQGFGQVNNPSTDGGEHIRTLEWKHMMPQEDKDNINGTLITREIPFTPNNPDKYEYPFPDSKNTKIFRKYMHLSSNSDKVLFCGRLGEYKYYDMDQAIENALSIAKSILESGKKVYSS